MYTTVIRYALTLIFCTFALVGWAMDEYIIDEDFSELPENTVLSEFHGWTFYGCQTGLNQSWANHALRVENYTIGGKKFIGYATTPSLNYSGDAILAFSYAKGTSKETTIDVSIELNGISKELESIVVKDGSQGTTFKTASIKLINITPETKIKFSEGAVDNTFAIDNVKVTKVPEMLLKDNINNTSTIESNASKTVTVNTVRTLTGGIWNTLCLPFDVTMQDMELALGTNQDIKMRTFIGYENGILHFSAVDYVTAGTPFLIKLNTTVKDPTFHAVTISNADARTVTSNNVSFVGTYSPQTLLTDGTNLFLTTSNTLSVPAEGRNTMRGLRAYFVVSSNFIPASARLAIDDETTGIETATIAQPRPAGTYDLNGRHVEHPRHGLYVVDGRLTFVK